MGRIYNAVINSMACTAVIDVFEIAAPSDAGVILHAISLSQSEDAGDSESEQLAVLLHRPSASGSGGTTILPNPIVPGTNSFGGTVEIYNTSQASKNINIWSEAFNVMAGLEKWWTPETRPVISPSGSLVLSIEKAPADYIALNGTMVIEEVGG